MLSIAKSSNEEGGHRAIIKTFIFFMYNSCDTDGLVTFLHLNGTHAEK